MSLDVKHMGQLHSNTITIS